MPGIVASIKFHVFFPNFSHFSNENKTPCNSLIFLMHLIINKTTLHYYSQIFACI